MVLIVTQALVLVLELWSEQQLGEQQQTVEAKLVHLQQEL